ncbi:hypothetical protein HQO42_27485 [Rhodococcus fascians]|nr:hypothetical protein [Rhodococcus fascians]MBY4240708.1 hypothetical protein [Rhodococcus fascians]MBY4256407.1 hypothetical protein [Rhodococcus fascians]MBY4270896.1 hypothetical protein [Rhodococcus fascians]
MWYLDAYEKKSELLTKSYPLRGVTTTIIKELIEVDERYGPVEAAMHEVAPTDLAKFAKYIDGELSIDFSCSYFVGLFAD